VEPRHPIGCEAGSDDNGDTKKKRTRGDTIIDSSLDSSSMILDSSLDSVLLIITTYYWTLTHELSKFKSRGCRHTDLEAST
jgi:hypothetical protein